MSLHPLHRAAFLQALMADSFMTEEQAKKLLRKMKEGANDDVYHQLLVEVNNSLAFAHLQVRTVLNPVDRIRYVGLINKTADELSKVATQYKIEERNYFKHVVEHIATSSNYVADQPSAPCASERELHNMDLSAAALATQPGSPHAAGPSGSQNPCSPTAATTTRLNRFSKADRVETLKRLIADNWLAPAVNQPHHVCLGARTFLELSEFLLSLELSQETRNAWQQVL
ncbi:Non-structural maintenance of chromosomes element 1 [Haematococcus lacustris]